MGRRMGRGGEGKADARISARDGRLALRCLSGPRCGGGRGALGLRFRSHGLARDGVLGLEGRLLRSFLCLRF